MGRACAGYSVLREAVLPLLGPRAWHATATQGTARPRRQFFRNAPLVLPLSDIRPMDRTVGTLSAVHWHLPVPSLPYASTRGVCMFVGAGVARNKRIDRVNLVDVAPTLAHILGIEPPAQCEGRVIREAILSEDKWRRGRLPLAVRNNPDIVLICGWEVYPITIYCGSGDLS